MAIAGSARKSTGNPLWLDNFRWKFVPVDAPVDAAQMNDVRLLSTIARVEYRQGAYDSAGRLMAYHYSAIAREQGVHRSEDLVGFTHSYAFQYGCQWERCQWERCQGQFRGAEVIRG